MRVQLEDAPVWANKIYVAKPRFMDPPVREYRKWAKKFVQPLNAASAENAQPAVEPPANKSA